MKNIGNGLGNHKTRKKLIALFAIKTSTYLECKQCIGLAHFIEKTPATNVGV